MNWFQRLSKTGRMEKELDAELRFHFESQVADKIQAGLTEAEARRATRLEFGGLDQIKQDCRESRGTLWLVLQRGPGARHFDDHRAAGGVVHRAVVNGIAVHGRANP